MNLIEELEKKKTIALNFPTNTEVVRFSDIQIVLSSARERLRKQLCLSMWPKENSCAYKNPCKSCMALDEELRDEHISPVEKR